MEPPSYPQEPHGQGRYFDYPLVSPSTNRTPIGRRERFDAQPQPLFCQWSTTKEPPLVRFIPPSSSAINVLNLWLLDVLLFSIVTDD